MVLVHAYPQSPEQTWIRYLGYYGWTGVDLFFVLSGYLIARQLFRQSGISSFRDVGHFYARRFFRTLPAYYVVLLLLAASPFFASEGLSPLWPYLALVSNYQMGDAFKASWSLCVEEHFYLIFPWVIWLVYRNQKSAWIPWLPLAIITFAVLYRAAVWLILRPDRFLPGDPNSAYTIYYNWLYYPSIARLDGLTIGVSLAAIECFKPTLWKSITSRGFNLVWLSVPIFFASAWVLKSFIPFLSSTIGFPLVSAGYAILLCYSRSDRFPKPSARLVTFLVSGLAQLSYCLYLTYDASFRLGAEIGRWLNFSPFGLAMFGVNVVCVLGLAAVLRFAVEAPFLTLRDRLLGDPRYRLFGDSKVRPASLVQ